MIRHLVLLVLGLRNPAITRQSFTMRKKPSIINSVSTDDTIEAFPNVKKKIFDLMTDLTLFRIPFFEENSFFETKKEICIFSFFLSSVGREKSS